MQKLWFLTISFALIGIGAYGGGLVTIPLMDHELVRSRQLLSEDEMAWIVAVAQMTPGPIAVNGATFVGYRVAGITGALLATVVVISPALIILSLLVTFRGRIRSGHCFLRLRRGLRAGILSLLIFATWTYGHGVITGVAELSMAVGAFLALVFLQKKIHPLVVIAGSGFIGLMIFR
ncbi:MAG: chromate transporter [Chitinivibrionales bacterium]